MNALPNIISASRAAAALAMLLVPVFSPGFWVLYCWGEISDMIDGMIARGLGAVSGAGSTIDSVADLLFVTCSAIMILPSVDLPVWIWLWSKPLTKSIAALLVGIAIDQRKIGSIDDNVLSYFPDYTPKRGEKTIQDVTIRHLLTMRAPYKALTLRQCIL